MRSRFIFLCLVFFLPWLLKAQVEEETLSGAAARLGGFGGPMFCYSMVGDMHGGGAGGGGAFVINDFFIGAFGQGETFGKMKIENQDYYLSLGYGGLWLGYVSPSHKLLHFYGSLKIAGGGAVLTETEGDHEVEYDDDAFVIHPEAGVELNVAHWFRLAAVGGYRFMNEIKDIPTLEGNDFERTTFSLVMRFGGFGY